VLKERPLKAVNATAASAIETAAIAYLLVFTALPLSQGRNGDEFVL
jgi:hypothetical protein